MLAERAESAHQEVPVGYGLTEVHRAVPGGKQGKIVLVQISQGPGVLGLQFLLRNLVNPCTKSLSEKLATRLTTDRIGDDVNRIGWIDKAE